MPKQHRDVGLIKSQDQYIVKLFKDNNLGVKIDLGCGANKGAGWIGVDFRKEPGVDIVQDLTKFPWSSIPDNCASIVRTSHLLEHVNPDSPDPRLSGLLDLLVDKGIITKDEIKKHIGDYRFLGGFIRFMDEVWRILKPGGQAHHTFPMAGSTGYWQDPTHVNPINEITLAYFDPLAKDPSGNFYNLYTIYRPKPWKIVGCAYELNGFMEVAFEKRLVDPSYHVSQDNGLSA